MKKAEVKIGGKYYANVSGKRTEIQIESEKASGGWNAINLATGKKILIKSAQRLLGTVGARKGRTKANTEATAAEAEPVTVEATNDATTEVAVPKKVRRAKTKEPVASEKKLSAIEAALKVLSESPEPMNTKQLIDSMASKGLWTSPGGKTPHATLYSAILREIVTKGDESRFVKSERGRFTTNA